MTKNSGLDLNEGTAIKIPLANLISLLAATAVAAWGYFNLMERATFLEHDMDLIRVEVDTNSEFTRLWPRGEMGALPADGRQDLKIEYLEGIVNKLQAQVDDLKEATYNKGES